MKLYSIALTNDLYTIRKSLLNRLCQLRKNTLFLYPLYKPQYRFRSIDKKVSYSREYSVVYARVMGTGTIFDLK